MPSVRSFLSVAANTVYLRCLIWICYYWSQELGINALHIKLCATGGNKTKTPGPGAQSALRAFSRSRMKIGHIGKHFCY